MGAGVVGLCCALELRSAGYRVTLLDRGDGGDGASHGNAGMLVPSHAIPLSAPGVISQGLRWLFRRDSPLYVRPRPDPALLRWLWLFRRACTAAHVQRAAPVLRDLALEGVDWYRDLSERVGGFDFERRGLLMVHSTESGRRHDLVEAEQVRALGIDVELLDREALAALEPGLRTEAVGAVLFRGDGHLHPGRLIATLLTRAHQEGVEVMLGTEVRGVRREGSRSLLEIESETLEVDRLVVAAGAFSGLLPGSGISSLPLQPAKGYSVTLPRAEGSPSLPMILSEAKVTVTPMGDRLRFAGTLELGGFDDSVDPRRARPILETARRYLPDLDVDGIIQGRVAPRIWAGYRPCSPDGLPYVGEVAGQPGWIVATGHGMLGVTLAPATARLVRELMSDGIAPPPPVRADRYTRGTAGTPSRREIG